MVWFMSSIMRYDYIIYPHPFLGGKWTRKVNNYKIQWNGWHWDNLVATKKMLICVGLIYVIICLNLCYISYTSFWKHFRSTKKFQNSYTYIHHPDSHNVNTWYIMIILYNCTVNTGIAVLIYLKFLLDFLHQFFPQVSFLSVLGIQNKIQIINIQCLFS